MSAYPGTSSFREIDLELALPKGSAFRAFKRLEPGLVQDRDYILLLAGEDHEAIGKLREAGRIYATSRNVVLVTAALRERLLQLLRTPQ